MYLEQLEPLRKVYQFFLKNTRNYNGILQKELQSVFLQAGKVVGNEADADVHL